MLGLKLARTKAPLRLLCLGSHADDIEIGAGGTVLTLLEDHPGAEVTWIVLGAEGARVAEAKSSAAAFLAGAAKAEVETAGFRDGYFPYQGAEIKDHFEQLKSRPSPDLILTHYRHDLHQDHRLVCELTWNTFRDHLILEYEVPKYDGDLGSPDLFVPLSVETCERKCALLLEHFKSQAGRHWFEEETFRSLMRLRGMEAGGATRYAEGFYSRKAVLV